MSNRRLGPEAPVALASSWVYRRLFSTTDEILLCRFCFSGGSSPNSLASRDQPKHQRNDKRAEKAAERKEQRVVEQNERFSTLKAKESSTMEMFKQLAAQRFGGGSS